MANKQDLIAKVAVTLQDLLKLLNLLFLIRLSYTPPDISDFLNFFSVRQISLSVPVS